MNYDDAAFSDTTHVVYNDMPLFYIFHFGTFRFVPVANSPC
jgi:hypothetical protein